MAGIRVSLVPNKVTEKEIKIHFTKPENGGGPIKEIYYPLLDNNAVVIFEDPIIIETVMAREQTLHGEIVEVAALHTPQIYTEMEAELDPSVASFLQATNEVRDELQYHRDVVFCMDRDGNIVSVRGNWYMLELVWAYIARFTQRQQEEHENQSLQATGDQVAEAGTRTRHHNQNSQHQHGLQESYEDQLPSSAKGEEPIISLPSVLGEGSIIGNRSEHVARHGDSAKAELKPDALAKKPGFTKQKREKIEKKIPVSSDGSDDDDSDDTEKKLAGLSLDDKTGTGITILNNNAEDVRSLDFKYGPLTVSIHSGMITMAETDAIVNAAMGSLFHAGGVAHAISSAAGPELQRQCDEYVSKHGNVPTTEVMHTCAGGRISPKVKYVMHAVGPVWSEYSKEHCPFELTQTFLNCMVYGNNILKIQSITMPVISSGIFGCPLEICVRSFLNAVLLFSYENMNKAVRLKEVNLVNNNNDNTALTVMQIRELITTQDADTLVKEAKTQLQQAKESSSRLAKVPGQRLHLDYGDASETGTSHLPSGYQHASPLSNIQTGSQSNIQTGSQSSNDKYRATVTSPQSSMTSRNDRQSLTSRAPLASSSQARASGKVSMATGIDDYKSAFPSNRTKTTDRTTMSDKQKSGPPTYDEYGQTGIRPGVTIGRALPEVPKAGSRSSKKY